PPGMAYVYRAAVTLSERVPPPPWATRDDWLHQCLKLLPVAGHGALALVLFAVVAAAARRGPESTDRLGGFRRGWRAATLHAWTPAALLDAAYWGQGDTLNATLLVLALGVLILFPGWWPVASGRRVRLGAQAGALAAGAAAGALLAGASLIK